MVLIICFKHLYFYISEIYGFIHGVCKLFKDFYMDLTN